MRRITTAIVLTCLAAAALPALAAPAGPEAEALAALEEQLPGTLMNNPYDTAWKTHGQNYSAKVVRVPEIPGEYAYEVRVRQAGRNPWDISVTAPLTAGVRVGDAVLVAFWARASVPAEDTGTGSAQVRVQQIGAPYTGIAESPVTVNPGWQLHYVKGIASGDHEANAINIAFNIAAKKQTLQFGQFYVMNLGQGVRLEDLPSGAEDL